MSTSIDTRVSNLEAQMEATQAILNQTVILQQQHVQAIAQIDERLAQMTQQQQQNMEAIAQLTQGQQQNMEAIAQLTAKQKHNENVLTEAMAQLTAKQKHNENVLTEAIAQLTAKQKHNENVLTEAMAQLTAKQNHNENVLTEVLRVMGNLGSRSNKNEAGVESLHDAVGRLTRAADADRQEMRAVTGRLDSMVSRLDVLVNHLISRDG